MRNNWLFFVDLDGGSPYILPAESIGPQSFGVHLLSQFSSFVDNSIHNSRYLFVPGSLALQEAFNCISKFAGALFFWFASGSTTNVSRNFPGKYVNSSPKCCKSPVQVKRMASSTQNLPGFGFNSKRKGKSAAPVIFGRISSFTTVQLNNLAKELQSFPLLSLAGALIPPFDNVSAKAIGIPVGNSGLQMQTCMDERPCEVGHGGCTDPSFRDIIWTRHVVEPRTGIEFPTVLDSNLHGDISAATTSEVLVGTGARTMTIIRIKSFKVYAFGFYIHPYDVCMKLGPKYYGVPASEVSDCNEFYKDLLRSDINMTVRLVVNYNGMRISSVRDVFEKSLRARLVKANPETDYDCLRKFGSLFSQDMPLNAGTIIDIRRTADGHLTTEIGGNQMGTVQSKDLCRAFFDMYIGDSPISDQTKEEIGRNVARIMGRC